MAPLALGRQQTVESEASLEHKLPGCFLFKASELKTDYTYILCILCCPEQSWKQNRTEHRGGSYASVSFWIYMCSDLLQPVNSFSSHINDPIYQKSHLFSLLFYVSLSYSTVLYNRTTFCQTEVTPQELGQCAQFKIQRLMFLKRPSRVSLNGGGR